MSATRAVLLDLDGTLADPREGFVRCARHALDRLGIACPPDDDLARHIGPPLHHTLGVLVGGNPSVAVGLFRERYETTGIFENTIYPGVPAMLRALRASGLRMFVATSKPTIFARRIIRHFGLDEFFDGLHGSELDGTRGDKAHLIAAMMDSERLGATATVMVGDREHDIRAARANGMSSVGALWGYGSRNELESAGATALCAAPSDLRGVLAAHAWPSHPSPFPA